MNFASTGISWIFVERYYLGEIVNYMIKLNGKLSGKLRSMITTDRNLY